MQIVCNMTPFQPRTAFFSPNQMDVQMYIIHMKTLQDSASRCSIIVEGVTSVEKSYGVVMVFSIISKSRWNSVDCSVR